MIKILVFSDSHRRIKKLLEITKENIDGLTQIIHLGDNISDAFELQKAFPHIPVACVRGNCDVLSDNDTEKVFSLGSNRFYITHGHTAGVKYDFTLLCSKAREKNADIALFGHTHIPCNEVHNRIQVFNPGSISEPRGSFMPSYGIICEHNGRTEFLHIFTE